MKKNKSKNIKTIDMTQLLINSKNKNGRHNPFVSVGTGAWKSAKDYTRKIKHRNNKIEF